MRVVMFQDRSVVNDLMTNKVVYTTLKNIEPLRGQQYDSNRYWLRSVDGSYEPLCNLSVQSAEDKMSRGAQIVRVFSAYYKMCLYGKQYYPTVETIYRNNVFWFGQMGYYGRDIIELEIPEDEILLTMEDMIVYIPMLKWEWVISILSFDKEVDDAARGELSMLYKNTIYNDNTYHMCYSADVCFNGHGYGDLPEYFKSAKIPDVDSLEVMEAYTQRDVYGAFVYYVYLKSVGTGDDVDIKEMEKAIEGKFKPYIKVFNMIASTAVNPVRTDTTYKERAAEIEEVYGGISQ